MFIKHHFFQKNLDGGQAPFSSIFTNSIKSAQEYLPQLHGMVVIVGGPMDPQNNDIYFQDADMNTIIMDEIAKTPKAAASLLKAAAMHATLAQNIRNSLRYEAPEFVQGAAVITKGLISFVHEYEVLQDLHDQKCLGREMERSSSYEDDNQLDYPVVTLFSDKEQSATDKAKFLQIFCQDNPILHSHIEQLAHQYKDKT
eukprot:NODE_964_length_1531_cov_49.097578_g953_i0.p1 GENE.NODE_964_length_1531_cov_49.097578_g953_i0~~NODE_964_length_1531_cov_49.097578_g953_i0.p1  ORF type:complete len:199 (+),score=27.30 NODE_964_length_1531_cov_49.097578_g953_i0:326-922(+)